MNTRPVINFVLDILAFVFFTTMLATGLALRYKVPPGSGGFHSQGYGILSLKKDIVLLWGMTRHQWGSIHFWLSIAFLAILSAHLFLHWKWIIMMIKGKSSPHSGKRLAIGIISFVGLVGMIIIPMLTPTAVVKRSQKMKPATQAMAQYLHKIRGDMTLQELKDYTGIQLSVFKNKFNIPLSTPNDINLGRLRREYGFSIQEVRLFIKKYKEQKK